MATCPLGMASFRGEASHDVSEQHPPIEQSYGLVELLTPDMGIVNRTTPNLAFVQKNVRVAIHDTLDVLTVECSIPLQGSGFSLGTTLGAPLSVRLETGELKM
jgi:hypothetical protein